jgi:hypothetical protein
MRVTAHEALMTHNELDLEQREEPREFGRLYMVLCILCALSVFAAVGYVADVGRGRAAGLCAGIDFAVIRLRSQSRGDMRFWLAIALILLLQTTVIVTFPFGSDSMPVYGLVPIGLIVYLIDECIIFLVKRRTHRKVAEKL